MARVLCWMLMLCAAAGCQGRRFSVPPLPSFIGPASSSVVWVEPFLLLGPDRWREVSVRGRTIYDVVTLDGRDCLRAFSRDGASILLSPVRFEPRDAPWLSWTWRVDRLVEREALETKQGSDAAARVYVYFESPGLPWQKPSLDYVWSAALPDGTVLSSAFSAKSKIIVVEHGAEALGQWRQVQRNIVEDYERTFGKAPPRVIAIGVMSDTDNTGGETLAYFDDLRVSRQPPDSAKGRGRGGATR